MSLVASIVKRRFVIRFVCRGHAVWRISFFAQLVSFSTFPPKGKKENCMAYNNTSKYIKHENHSSKKKNSRTSINIYIFIKTHHARSLIIHKISTSRLVDTKSLFVSPPYSSVCASSPASMQSMMKAHNAGPTYRIANSRVIQLETTKFGNNVVAICTRHIYIYMYWARYIN